MTKSIILALFYMMVTETAALGMQRLRPPAESAVRKKTTIWLDAFARSGSSVLYALIQHAGKHDEHAVGDPFEIYEPCHYKNELEPELLQKGCDGLMHKVLQCDFTGIKSLRFALPEHAEDACKNADIVLYKTVNLTKTVPEMPLLNSMKASPNLVSSVLSYAAEKNVRVVELVRDPRGIYASWVDLREFRHNVVRDPSTLTDICDVFAANLALSDESLHRVVFEDLVRHPGPTAQNLMDFLGLQYGQATQNWIKDHFESDCGYDDSTVGGAYRLCQNDPESHIEKWRSVLNHGEMNAFTRHPACRKIAKAFNYTLDELDDATI